MIHMRRRKMTLKIPLHEEDFEVEKAYSFKENSTDNELGFLASLPGTFRDLIMRRDTSDKWHYFKLLDQESLHKSENATDDISRQALVEFLHALKNNWLEFLEHELEVKPMYMMQFVLKDIKMHVMDYVDRKLSEFPTSEEKTAQLQNMRQKMMQQWSQTQRNVLLNEPDAKKYIERLCEEKLNSLTENELLGAKTIIMSALEADFQSNQMMDANIEILAEIMLCIESKKLIEKMEQAFANDKKYSLKTYLDVTATPELRKYLGLETILATGVEYNAETNAQLAEVEATGMTLD